MLAKQIVLCLCATLAVAIPIKFDESIIETASDSAITKDMDLAENIPMSQDDHQEKMLILAVLNEMEVLAKDKIKRRTRRDIFRVKCPAGEIKIGGICMSCQDMGTC